MASKSKPKRKTVKKTGTKKVITTKIKAPFPYTIVVGIYHGRRLVKKYKTNIPVIQKRMKTRSTKKRNLI